MNKQKLPQPSPDKLFAAINRHLIPALQKQEKPSDQQPKGA